MVAPPHALFRATISPRWRVTMAWQSANPNPMPADPAVPWLRAYGFKLRLRSASASP